MSVEKIAAVVAPGTPAPATINFYYELSKLFNSVSLRSNYRAKMVKDQTGTSQLDEVAISQDEKDIVNEILEQAVFDVFGELFKISESVLDPIFFNTDYTPAGVGAVAAKCCGGKLLDNDAYNDNILKNIDKKIENALRFYILSEWYIACSMGDDAGLNKVKYLEYLRQIKNLSFELRKPLMS